MTLATVAPTATPTATPEQPFVAEMLRQLRSLDSYGTQDGWTDEQVLKSVILTAEERRAMPVIGDPDSIVLSRVSAYYNAVATRIESQTGKMATPLVKITHEGFGRVLIIVGKLVALDRTVRDVHRFGFKSQEQLEQKGEALVKGACATIDKFLDCAEA